MSAFHYADLLSIAMLAFFSLGIVCEIVWLFHGRKNDDRTM